MKKILAALVLLNCKLITANCQPAYWQQEVNYQINVSLNDKEHTLDGFIKMEYSNHSPDTLTYIWFHVWPNAYKNDKTAFSDQLLENGNTDFYFSGREDKGYINRLDFKVNGITAETEDHPHHIDIIKLLLPAPLAPGQKIDISTPFHVKLPFNFSRGGHDGQSYQVTQWYPKPAVYDKQGWHPMPYLDQGEFYSEFGNFDVSITVPANYVVAATGELQNADEKEWLKTRAGFTWEPIRTKIKKGGTVKTVMQADPTSATEIKTLRFRQETVHDFAWFADKRFIVARDTCRLASGKIIEVYSYYTASQKQYWNNSVGFAKDAIRTRSEWIGEYPFSVVSVVQGPESFGGGMEYPTITVISPTKDEKLLDFTIAHEIGHNWFYGILGSNERQYPWMDEGLNTYYDNRYSHWKYGDKGEIKIGSAHISIKNAERVLFETKAVARKDQPINTASEEFTNTNYGLIAYYKTGAWLEYMESVIGKEAFDRAMRAYYNHWKFKHPQPEDFEQAIEENSGKKLDTLFSLLDKKGTLPLHQRRGTKSAFLFNFKSHANYINNPVKNYLVYGPSMGFNSYDKLMVGGFITNYKLPPSKFQFFLAPMFGLGSKRGIGLGLFNYTSHMDGFLRKIDIGISGSTFTLDRYEDTLGNKVFTSFRKIVPRIRFTFNEKRQSTLLKYLQFKTFFIHESFLRLRRDSLFPGTDTIVLELPYTIKERRTLNQLLFVVQDYRALYPYRAELKAEQGKGFIRFAFTGNYFFNYSKTSGGVDVRFFAGKFIYTNKSTADPFLYGLNMSAPKGNLDYTYSDYFIGRSDDPFNINDTKWKIPYQQIMIRDGGFKVNTDVQGNIGASDNWLIAGNASFDIPANINPLSLTPLKIPLKAFFDIGTYRETWKKGATTDRFLYDAGIQLSLLKNLLNIYIPILYSKPFKDYYKEDFFSKGKNRFLKTISFSIDISGFNLRKFNRNLAD